MDSNKVRIRPTNSPDPSRQENYTVFLHSLRIRVVVTAKPVVVRKWIYAIGHRHRILLRNGRLVVGLGVQWTHGRNAGAATLQLCVGHTCLIFQLRHADQSPAILRRFLSNSNITFVGVWNYRDADMLSDSRHSLRVTRLVDLRHPASTSFRGCSLSASMETLASDILGWDGMSKEETVGRSNWDVEWLSKEQVRYAALDVVLSFFMGKKLRVWNYPAD
ncbi:hypothetical protein ACS0TY_024945 [Phlomoides rotata]